MSDESNRAWELSSNSGRESISGKLVGQLAQPDDVVLFFDLQCRAERYDWYFKDPLVPHIELNVFRVAFSKSKVVSCISELRRWLEEPMEMKLDVSAENGRRVDFYFGPYEKMITTKHRPACVFTYAVSFTTFEIGFVVDQSCIRILADSLQDVLDGI